MRNHLQLAFALISLFLAFSGSCASQEPSFSLKENELCFETWKIPDENVIWSMTQREPHLYSMYSSLHRETTFSQFQLGVKSASYIVHNNNTMDHHASVIAYGKDSVDFVVTKLKKLSEHFEKSDEVSWILWLPNNSITDEKKKEITRSLEPLLFNFTIRQISEVVPKGTDLKYSGFPFETNTADKLRLRLNILKKYQGTYLNLYLTENFPVTLIRSVILSVKNQFVFDFDELRFSRGLFRLTNFIAIELLEAYDQMLVALSSSKATLQMVTNSKKEDQLLNYLFQIICMETYMKHTKGKVSTFFIGEEKHEKCINPKGNPLVNRIQPIIKRNEEGEMVHIEGPKEDKEAESMLFIVLISEDENGSCQSLYGEFIKVEREKKRVFVLQARRSTNPVHKPFLRSEDRELLVFIEEKIPNPVWFLAKKTKDYIVNKIHQDAQKALFIDCGSMQSVDGSYSKFVDKVSKELNSKLAGQAFASSSLTGKKPKKNSVLKGVTNKKAFAHSLEEYDYDVFPFFIRIPFFDLLNPFSLGQNASSYLMGALLPTTAVDEFKKIGGIGDEETKEKKKREEWMDKARASLRGMVGFVDSSIIKHSPKEI